MMPSLKRGIRVQLAVEARGSDYLAVVYAPRAHAVLNCACCAQRASRLVRVTPAAAASCRTAFVHPL